VIAQRGLVLSAEQRSAVDAPSDSCFAITGAAGTGKSTALDERIARGRALYPSAQALVIPSPSRLDEYAIELLQAGGIEATLIDDVEAALLFASTCASLFTLEWEEFAQNQLDPEIPGLRSPERFLESAFRLIRRLRDADIDPEFFMARSLRGATEFYAKPPNFADPALLAATKDSYHDSLDVTGEELERQYRREIDLAKILTKLYQGYVELVESSGRMTGRDAVIAARNHLRDNASLAAQLRERHRFAFIDDAENLTSGELHLLAAIFGESLAGVTLCGDASSAISTTRKVDPELTFALAASRIELREQYRSPFALRLAGGRITKTLPANSALELHRAGTPREEAVFIAERVAAWLDEGTPPEEIAVLFRSVRDVELYEKALLDRNIPVLSVGDANLFTDRRVLDALALIWNVYDPFRHDWILRTLGNPAFGLADASLAILCAEPPDLQRPLFALDDEPAPTTRASRWDPKRDLRLGWNVIRGDQDGALTEDARGRVRRFRRLREEWVSAMHALPFEEFARTVWREGLAREGPADSARARAQQLVLQRLLTRLGAFLAQEPDATTLDVLEYAQRRTQSDLETCEGEMKGRFVRLSSICAARGLEFDRVVVASVRAGSFPLWHSPDAFLFSPRLGMVPKENAGDARASRTAKFSYYTFRAKLRERYNAQERRALMYALRRARKSVLVTASGPPTKGTTAPEFLEELR
jgi:DNA helicase II / ATP-dependent DNA helicase PcrA